MSNGTVTWNDIRALFTDIDIDHMKGVTGDALDLSDCESVQHWAKQIYVVVSQGIMPPGSPWPPDWVAKFKQWVDAGAPCPTAQPLAAKASKPTKAAKSAKATKSTKATKTTKARKRR